MKPKPNERFYVRKWQSTEDFGRGADIHYGNEQESGWAGHAPLLSMNLARGPYEGKMWLQAGALSCAVPVEQVETPKVVVHRKDDLQMQVGPIEIDMDSGDFLDVYREAVRWCLHRPEVAHV